MKEFASIEEAKKYGEDFSKRQWEKVKVGDKNIILCGTDMAYEEDIYSDSYELLENHFLKFGVNPKTNNIDLTDCVTELRDTIIKFMEEKLNMEFIDVCEEY